MSTLFLSFSEGGNFQIEALDVGCGCAPFFAVPPLCLSMFMEPYLEASWLHSSLPTVPALPSVFSVTVATANLRSGNSMTHFATG